MTFANQLKEQLSHFVESYRKYFLKTFVVAMTFTILCYLASAVLLRLDTSDTGIKLTNLINLIFSRYSYKSYQLVDLSASFWFFFIALFALLLAKFNKEDHDEITEFSFGNFVSRITPPDIGTLLMVLAASCLIDFLFFETYSFLAPLSGDALSNYLFHLTFRLRQYIPMILYGLSIQWLLDQNYFKITGRSLLLLFLWLWGFHEMALEFFLFIRDIVLNLLLLHFANSELLIFYQSLLTIPIVGFLFVGYYAAFTSTLKVAPSTEIIMNKPAEED
jgi:hypothetical protein